jgi:hypothetical protein
MFGEEISPIDFRVKKENIMTNIAWIVLVYSVSKFVYLTQDAMQVILWQKKLYKYNNLLSLVPQKVWIFLFFSNY